jgi:hypothetical protein
VLEEEPIAFGVVVASKTFSGTLTSCLRVLIVDSVTLAALFSALRTAFASAAVTKGFIFVAAPIPFLAAETT